LVLSPKNCRLLFIDVQEKLFAKVQDNQALLKRLEVLFEAAKLLEIPSLLSEQYPQGLGPTIEPLRAILPRYEKTAFSCLGDAALKKAILAYPEEYWIVVGIESHVCVLQTAKDLLRENKKVVVPLDAISSRNALDHQIAIDTFRSLGAHITTTETLLFELLGDAKHPQFKAISRLIK